MIKNERPRSIAASKESLLHILRVLSTEPREQVLYLERLGVAPSADELALEFDDLFPAVAVNLAEMELSAISLLNAQLA